ncbi:hypothetical protein AWJ26_gp53 (endogenous virus) [Sinorhizobium phage phiLM21]|uniref:hypothetical protein n=1 Tax=Sinorhizobium phage phiLM21 TaxID=1524882 RepID=UPI0004E5C7D3|nr:hypothetical protein AWJ26_gp53 [Sinorhizobium phage phiLM21]AII27807.1 hypothetical protein phiLM21_p056 [Sinorhizobium phage phiLM21]
MDTKRVIKGICTFTICLTVQSCAFGIPRSYVNPKEVSLERAMQQTACGLSTFNNELARMGYDPGLINDQVDVTMNLTASATGTGTLVLDTKTAEPVAFFAPIGVKYTDETVVKGDRNNTIKITMKNMYTAGLNDPGKGVVKRDGRPLGLGPRIMSARERPCEVSPSIEAAAKQGASRSAQQSRPVQRTYSLDCSPFGAPNVAIKVPPSSLSRQDQERACTGIQPNIGFN